jgi:hypothetical protein
MRTLRESKPRQFFEVECPLHFFGQLVEVGERHRLKAV